MSIWYFLFLKDFFSLVFIVQICWWWTLLASICHSLYCTFILKEVFARYNLTHKYVWAFWGFCYVPCVSNEDFPLRLLDTRMLYSSIVVLGIDPAVSCYCSLSSNISFPGIIEDQPKHIQFSIKLTCMKLFRSLALFSCTQVHTFQPPTLHP